MNMASLCYLPDEKESTLERLRREFYEFEKLVDKYFDDLDNVEEMCEEAQANMERFQLKAEAKKEIVRQDAKMQAKLCSAVKEM